MTIREFAEDPCYRKRVRVVARAQMKRRRRDYEALAILDREDLAQEMWENLTEMYRRGLHLAMFCDDEFEPLCCSLAEKIARCGERKRCGYEEVPFSDLDDREKRALRRQMRG